ncbi:DegV family protein [Ruminococcus sp. 5_1_39BFAA]|uniref:DegV family protein n=1 Tax=Ruminococcus sp. 5_1_39BFAA TaxID=457412 RepID=UPI003566393C
MKKYIILAETGADIPAGLAEQYGIYTVPMHVSFGSETKDDGTFPTSEVFDFYKKSGILPRTSGCNVTDFDKVFDEIHAKYPESRILYLAYSAATTCSYQSAAISAEHRDYVTAFDTKQVSAGQCLVVILMARFLEANPDADLSVVLKKAEQYRQNCHMGFFPGDLDYLRAGGRVSNIAYLGAKILSLNPLIELVDGKLVATKKYRGNMNRVSQKLFAEFIEKYKLSRDFLYCPYSPGLSENIKHEIENQAAALGFREIRWIQTGSVVSTHSGPGAFGVCGISEE